MPSLVLLLACALIILTVTASNCIRCLLDGHHHIWHDMQQLSIAALLCVIAARLTACRCFHRPLRFPRCYWLFVFTVFASLWFYLISGVTVASQKVQTRSFDEPSSFESTPPVSANLKQLNYTLAQRPWLIHKAYMEILRIEVGTPVTRRPPRRSRRAELPHRAPRMDARGALAS